MNLTEFKKGQKVVCIKESELKDKSWGIKGKIYTVESFNLKGLSLEELDGKGCNGDRFTDAAKWLHNKQFQKKLEDLVE